MTDGRTQVRFRIPNEMLARLEQSASANFRPLNAEVVALLSYALDGTPTAAPRPTVPPSKLVQIAEDLEREAALLREVAQESENVACSTEGE